MESIFPTRDYCRPQWAETLTRKNQEGQEPGRTKTTNDKNHEEQKLSGENRVA